MEPLSQPQCRTQIEKVGWRSTLLKKEETYVILHDVPRGKPNYRRQFGKAICQKAMVGVVVEVVREGVVVELQNFRVVCVCDC